MKKKRLISKAQIIFLSIMFILIVLGIFIFWEYNRTLSRRHGQEIEALWGIRNADFETYILILFIISTIFYFSVIAVVTGRSHSFFRGQSALISSFLKDYDSMYYVKLFENKYEDEIESYHFSDDFLRIFNIENAGNRFFEILQYAADKIVFYEDRDRFIAETRREIIVPAIEKFGTYFTNFRVEKEGYISVYQIKFTFAADTERKQRGMICGIRCIDNEINAQHRLRENFNIKVAEKTQEIREQNLMLNKLNENIVEFLGSVIENRALYESDHIRNVKCLTGILAMQLSEDYPEYSLTQSEISMLTSACALHDIGKIKIPYEILYKKGNRTPEETELIKTHTVEGKNILEMYNPGWSEVYQRMCIDICMFHHERYDGSGYPKGLVGDETPILAQIVSVIDCFDILTSGHGKPEAIGVDDALEMICEGKFGKFNPKLIDSLKNIESSLRAFAENPSAFVSSNEIVHTNYNILSNINILLVVDDEKSANSIKKQLENNGASVTVAANGKKGYEIFVSEPSSFDIILMDILMPVMDGITATEMIRSSGKPQSENIPIIALLSEADQERIAKCMAAGMNTYLTTPIVISRAASVIYESINSQSKELQRKLSSVIRDAHRDALTGVKTKMLYFEEIKKLNDKINGGDKIEFGVVVFDLNDLKKVNDNLGHSEGDIYIKNASRIICRVYDHSPVFRIGGDEFVAILMGEDFKNRQALLSQFVHEVNEAEKLESIKIGKTSVAHGSGVFSRGTDFSFSDVFDRADKELYRNKTRMKKISQKSDLSIDNKKSNGGGGGYIFGRNNRKT